MNTQLTIKEVVELSKIEDLTKAEKIASSYAPMMNEVTEQGNLLKQLEKGNAEDVGKAKRIKLDLGKICSRAAQQKTIDKQVVLLETRFIDALFNSVNGAARLNQEEAKEIEQHFDIIERERIVKLQGERETEVRKYSDEMVTVPDFLGAMNDDIWNNYFTGVKANYTAKLEAEKLAEQQRIEANKKEVERIKQLAIDNAKLIEAAKLKEAQDLADEKERQRLAKIAADKIKAERAEQDRIRIEKEAANNKIIAIEKAKSVELAAKIQAAKDAELKAESDRLAAIEAQLSKGDADKIKDLKADLWAIRTKYEFKSKKNQLLYQSVGLLIEKIINFINK